MMVPKGNAVQLRLRAVSHTSHVRINHHPLLAGLAGRDYPLSTYRTVLVAYYHLYQQIEIRIEQFIRKGNIPFDYSARLKLPWLADDLKFFNENPQARLPVPPLDFPEITSIGQLVGVLYTVEGSTLGGQVISRQLLEIHRLTLGARFFNGYGKDTEENWQRFCQFAEAIQCDEIQCQTAEAAALLTFNGFEGVLNAYHRADC
jgi:heme oxygenase